MRILNLASMLAISAIAAASSAHAQTYAPDYPVCLHVYGRMNYYECAYTSLPQCNLSASGRGAQCEVNPYFAYAEPPLGVHRYHRGHHHHRHAHRPS